MLLSPEEASQQQWEGLTLLVLPGRPLSDLISSVGSGRGSSCPPSGRSDWKRALPLCSSSGGSPAVRRALGAWTLGYLLAPGSLPAHAVISLAWPCRAFPQHCVGSSSLEGP